MDSAWTGRFIRLWATGRQDLDVIAILMTESHFRSSGFRIFEFTCYSLLRLIRSPRANTISLGLGQVQARHWPLPPKWSSVGSAEVAYDLISESMPTSTVSLRAKVAVHVGEVRGFYMGVAEAFHKQATAMAHKASLSASTAPRVQVVMAIPTSTQSRSLAPGKV
jgi:hypothetical protein